MAVMVAMGVMVLLLVMVGVVVTDSREVMEEMVVTVEMVSGAAMGVVEGRVTSRVLQVREVTVVRVGLAMGRMGVTARNIFQLVILLLWTEELHLYRR